MVIVYDRTRHAPKSLRNDKTNSRLLIGSTPKGGSSEEMGELYGSDGNHISVGDNL